MCKFHPKTPFHQNISRVGKKESLARPPRKKNNCCAIGAAFLVHLQGVDWSTPLRRVKFFSNSYSAVEKSWMLKKSPWKRCENTIWETMRARPRQSKQENKFLWSECELKVQSAAYAFIHSVRRLIKKDNKQQRRSNIGEWRVSILRR